MAKFIKWTVEEKLSILKEADLYGVTPTIRKHGIFYANYYRWKERYELEGAEGLRIRHSNYK